MCGQDADREHPAFEENKNAGPYSSCALPGKQLGTPDREAGSELSGKIPLCMVVSGKQISQRVEWRTVYPVSHSRYIL